MDIQIKNLIFVILFIFFCAIGYVFYKNIVVQKNPFHEQHMMDNGEIMDGAEMKE